VAAAERTERIGLAGHAAPLVRGEAPPTGRWRALDRLERFRAARFVLDAELVAPGAAPAELRERAAAFFRRLGAPRAAALVERSRAVAWRALSDYFERPSTDRAAIEALLAAVGHGEAELVLREGDTEKRLAGGGGRELPAERTCSFGAAELVLRAAEFDEPLRALFALFRRELPPPAAAPPPAGPCEIVGESPALLAALDRLRRFAATELPVLVLGENGTGKELAARLVHAASTRAAAPRVAVNCAGLAESLLLSELFGHARGAYTGAERERAGYFESARGGTIFLDEIGDFPSSAQGSLLRVLQEREIRRLGESIARRVDVRVVAATNRDLEAMVEEGKFRQDLFFRLKAATVTLPPLRERGNDVLVLAEHALSGLRRRCPGLKLTPEARRALLAHAWPGNVRELLNVLEAAAALTEDGRIAPEHLDLGGAPAPAKGRRPGDYHVEMDAFRRRLIESAMSACGGNLAAAARKLGVSRQFLSQFARKYALRPAP
jgi:transcriptional regulator with GAF, ATPase, and Fis domain